MARFDTHRRRRHLTNDERLDLAGAKKLHRKAIGMKVRGKVAEFVFQKTGSFGVNASELYDKNRQIRRYVKNSGGETVKQEFDRARMARAVRQWKALPESEKDVYREARKKVKKPGGSVYDNKYFSGYTLYCSLILKNKSLRDVL